MKSMLVFLAIISATFAWRNYVHWLPNSLLSKVPWYITKNLDFNMEATIQCSCSKQDVFKSGQVYFIIGKNDKFLCANRQNQIIATGDKPGNRCSFNASVMENGNVTLQRQNALGNFLYLHENSIMSNGRNISALAQFVVEVCNVGPWIGAHYVYLKAANGYYWSPDTKSKIQATPNPKETTKRMIVMEVL